MMSLFIISMLTKPVVGAVVDKFRVKKYMFMVFIFSTGISAFFLMYVSRLSVETSIELNCGMNVTNVKIYFDHTNKLSDCDQKILMGNNGESLVSCKVFITYPYEYIIILHNIIYTCIYTRCTC